MLGTKDTRLVAILAKIGFLHDALYRSMQLTRSYGLELYKQVITRSRYHSVNLKQITHRLNLQKQGRELADWDHLSQSLIPYL